MKSHLPHPFFGAKPILAAAFLLVTGSFASAATITLINADFSTGTNGKAFTGGTQGWTSYTTTGVEEGAAGSVSYWCNDAANKVSAFAGLKAGGGYYIAQAFASSDEGAVTASTFDTYTIAFDSAYRDDGSRGRDIVMEVSLWSGSTQLVAQQYTLIATGTGAAPSHTAPERKTFTLSYDNSQYALSDPIEIRFSNTNYLSSAQYNETALVDNVAITATAIPEPSTYGAIAGTIAIVGALVLRRRKAK
jgi:hypothetical protein